MALLTQMFHMKTMGTHSFFFGSQGFKHILEKNSIVFKCRNWEGFWINLDNMNKYLFLQALIWY